jgi:hypothetical protein
MIKMPKENIIIKGKVRVEIIDKKTGKVVDASEHENAFVAVGAQYLMQCLLGTATLHTYNKVNLYTSTGSLIKGVDGTYSSISDTGSAKQVTLTALDNSTDTYTVLYEGISYQNESEYGANAFCNKESTAKTKGSDQNLKVTWTITIGYSPIPT